jgi:2-amino-4-hydroxy-6-hydroxymethyldihydropteridine diphosphokinase
MNAAGLPIVIAIGSNRAGLFGSPLSSCRRAVAEIAALPFLRGCNSSNWYDTEPVPKSMQPNFINGVAVFESDPGLDPAVLLQALQAIETSAGRVRAEPNGPRTLDLDIIAMGRVIRDAPDPVLPHPRMHLRRFVLEPLRDVLPGWRHPVLGTDIGRLLARLPPDGARRLAVDEVD